MATVPAGVAAAVTFAALASSMGTLTPGAAVAKFARDCLASGRAAVAPWAGWVLTSGDRMNIPKMMMKSVQLERALSVWAVPGSRNELTLFCGTAVVRGDGAAHGAHEVEERLSGRRSGIIRGRRDA